MCQKSVCSWRTKKLWEIPAGLREIQVRFTFRIFLEKTSLWVLECLFLSRKSIEGLILSISIWDFPRRYSGTSFRIQFQKRSPRLMSHRVSFGVKWSENAISGTFSAIWEQCDGLFAVWSARMWGIFPPHGKETRTKIFRIVEMKPERIVVMFFRRT